MNHTNASFLKRAGFCATFSASFPCRHTVRPRVTCDAPGSDRRAALRPPQDCVQATAAGTILLLLQEQKFSTKYNSVICAFCCCLFSDAVRSPWLSRVHTAHI